MGELIVNGIKIAFMVGIIAAFATAITTILNLLSTVAFDGILAQACAFISMYLPFDLGSVMVAIGVSIAAILSFMVANKIWNLISNRIQL